MCIYDILTERSAEDFLRHNQCKSNAQKVVEKRRGPINNETPLEEKRSITERSKRSNQNKDLAMSRNSADLSCASTLFIFFFNPLCLPIRIQTFIYIYIYRKSFYEYKKDLEKSC